MHRREFYRKFSQNGEVEYCIDELADEIIKYNEENEFYKLKFGNIDRIDPLLQKYFDELYSRINNLFNFNDGIDAWQITRKFIIDGFISYGIVYNDEKTKIIGFKELDPNSLTPYIKEDDGKYKKAWTQYIGTKMERELENDQVIHISWPMSRYYIDRLVRPYNLLRIVENSHLILKLFNNYPDSPPLPSIPVFANIDANTLEYFRDKFFRSSKLPINDKDEKAVIRFKKYVKNIQNAFKELILKPIKIQMKLDNIHTNYIDNIDIEFNKE